MTDMAKKAAVKAEQGIQEYHAWWTAYNKPEEDIAFLRAEFGKALKNGEKIKEGFLYNDLLLVPAGENGYYLVRKLVEHNRFPEPNRAIHPYRTAYPGDILILLRNTSTAMARKWLHDLADKYGQPGTWPYGSYANQQPGWEFPGCVRVMVVREDEYGPQVYLAMKNGVVERMAYADRPGDLWHIVGLVASGILDNKQSEKPEDPTAPKPEGKWFPVINGQAYSNTGWRQIALDIETMKIRPAWRAVRTGYMPARNTTQTAARGDLVIRIEWGNGMVSRSYYLVDNIESYKWTKLPMEEGQTMWSALQSKPWFSAVKEFLTPPRGRNMSYLPVGYGWDGVLTISEKQKRDRMKAAFRPWLENKKQPAVAASAEAAVEAGQRSPGHGLPCSWHEEALHMPLTMDGSRAETGHQGAIGWFLLHDSGAIEYLVPQKEIAMPETVVKAIRIEWLAYRRNSTGELWGAKWELYKR